MLFRRLQSKIAQIQTVKIFWPSNIPSSHVASFYTSCSVHEKCSNLTGIPWKPGTGASFFTVHLTGVTRNLQAVRYIFSFFFHVTSNYSSRLMWNSRFTVHFYKLWASSASAVIRSWFIYELQKSTTIAFSRNSLYTFYSRNPTCGIPPCLRISNRKYPSCPQNSIIVNPPSPSEILKAVRGMVWIFSGIDHC